MHIQEVARKPGAFHSPCSLSHFQAILVSIIFLLSLFFLRCSSIIETFFARIVCQIIIKILKKNCYLFLFIHGFEQGLFRSTDADLVVCRRVLYVVLIRVLSDNKWQNKTQEPFPLATDFVEDTQKTNQALPLTSIFSLLHHLCNKRRKYWSNKMKKIFPKNMERFE